MSTQTSSLALNLQIGRKLVTRKWCRLHFEAVWHARVLCVHFYAPVTIVALKAQKEPRAECDVLGSEATCCASGSRLQASLLGKKLVPLTPHLDIPVSLCTLPWAILDDAEQAICAE